MRTRQKVKIRKSTRYFYIICIMSLIIVLGLVVKWTELVTSLAIKIMLI